MQAIEIRKLSPQPALAMHLQCAPHEMASSVPQALAKIGERADAIKAARVGAASTRYAKHDTEAGLFQLEVGIPVSTSVGASGDIIASELPGGRAACLRHEGPYHTLGQSFARLIELVANDGLEASGPPWESYVVGPASEAAPSKWRTELVQPVAS